MIVERIRKDPLTEAPESSLPAAPRVSSRPLTAMRRATVALGIAVLVSIGAAWHFQTQALLYEAMLDHTNIRHHDSLGNPWFDKRIDDCVACGVKIKSSDGR